MSGTRGRNRSGDTILFLPRHSLHNDHDWKVWDIANSNRHQLGDNTSTFLRLLSVIQNPSDLSVHHNCTSPVCARRPKGTDFTLRHPICVLGNCHGKFDDHRRCAGFAADISLSGTLIRPSNVGAVQDSTTASVTAGQAAAISILQLMSGPGYSGSVSLTCSGCASRRDGAKSRKCVDWQWGTAP